MAICVDSQAEGTTRLVTRTSTTMVGGAWEVFNRIAFVMERKMLLTIKSLSESGKTLITLQKIQVYFNYQMEVEK